MPLWLLDSELRGWGYRATQSQWLLLQSDEFHTLVLDLIGPDLRSPSVKKKHVKGLRGVHDPVIIGHYRQSTDVSFCITALIHEVLTLYTEA